MNLSSCKLITRIGIVGTPNWRLHTLGIANMADDVVNNETVRELTYTHPDLTALDLSGNKHVTHVSVDVIRVNCPKMKTLNVAGCQGLLLRGFEVGEQAVEFGGDGCPASCGCQEAARGAVVQGHLCDGCAASRAQAIGWGAAAAASPVVVCEAEAAGAPCCLPLRTVSRRALFAGGMLCHGRLEAWLAPDFGD